MKSLALAAAAALTIAACFGGSCAAQGDNQSRPGDAVRAACKDDIAKVCADTSEGHGPFRCLREHQDQLSDGCKTALANARAQFHGHGGWSNDRQSQN
jgi:hypothetical protein